MRNTGYYDWSLNNANIKSCRKSCSKSNCKCKLKSVILNLENYNISTSNPSLETLNENIPIIVTLSAPTKEIKMENKDSAFTSLCDNQVPLLLNRMC